MNFSVQPTLENDKVILYPLLKTDFENLFAVGSDPAIWAEHPNKNRYQRAVFQNFFDGAISSGGAFKIVDKATGEIIGSTRFYDYDAEESSILIGYTFFATSHWSKGYNHAAKKLMLDYIFEYVSKVILHIGANNKRSLRSIENLGGKKIAEEMVTYYGESPKLNCVYEITKEMWKK